MLWENQLSQASSLGGGTLPISRFTWTGQDRQRRQGVSGPAETATYAYKILLLYQPSPPYTVFGLLRIWFAA